MITLTSERYMVEEQIDGVSVPNIGKVQDYIRIIDRSGFFEVTSLSEDDNQMIYNSNHIIINDHADLPAC